MLLGKGALANYHDVEDGTWEEFNAWHTHEHLEERVNLPGFLRGRRYTAMRGSPQFFILYETEDVSVLSSEPYLERLDQPTDWTRAMSRAMTLTIRTAAGVTASLGSGVGGVALTWRLTPLPGRATQLRDFLVNKGLPFMLDSWGVVGAHLLEADAETSAIQSVEDRERQGTDQRADWLVIIEGTGEVPVQAVTKALSDPEDHGASSNHERALYRLQALRVAGE